MTINEMLARVTLWVTDDPSTGKPQYPLTPEEEQRLMEREESHASQYDSLAEWHNEVAQFGDATFQKPTIKPLTYSPELQALKAMLDDYSQAVRDWEQEHIFNSPDNIPDSYIPF